MCEIPIFGKAAPHPRSYGTFARVLGVYVLERHMIPMEEAIHKMSGMPTARLKLGDRGFIKLGMKADVVVFDAGKVMGKSTFEKPHQYSEGFRDVLVRAVCAAGWPSDGGAAGARFIWARVQGERKLIWPGGDAFFAERELAQRRMDHFLGCGGGGQAVAGPVAGGVSSQELAARPVIDHR